MTTENSKSFVKKSDYLTPAIEGIKSIIGEANISRCWWKFELGKTEEEWRQWYVTEAFRNGD